VWQAGLFHCFIHKTLTNPIRIETQLADEQRALSAGSMLLVQAEKLLS
jgi:hypothetical protein